MRVAQPIVLESDVRRKLEQQVRIPVDVGTRFHWMWAPDSV
jgi:hypothetical protein